MKSNFRNLFKWKEVLGYEKTILQFPPNVSYNLFKYQDGNKQNLNTPFQIYLLDDFTGDMVYKKKRIFSLFIYYESNIKSSLYRFKGKFV